MPEIANKTDEQVEAEADVDSFRKDLGPFVVATEMTRMAMVFTDAKEPNYPIVFANDSFLELTGYE
ncbi:MAG: histidine kinase, partial [Alphaproteobacteria bacterium]|nr:histidine kinase [Alphaproteobacteria bacterium]